MTLYIKIKRKYVYLFPLQIQDNMLNHLATNYTRLFSHLSFAKKSEYIMSNRFYRKFH